MFQNLEVLIYIYEIEGPQHSRNFAIKRRQTLLNPIFCLTSYKGEGEKYNNFIVDFSKPLDLDPFTIHNTYVALSCLCFSKGLVLHQNITIEDFQKKKYSEGTLK